MSDDHRRESWLKLRHQLGRNHDRVGALRLVSAAAGYVPLPHQFRFHVAGAGRGEVTKKLALAGVGAGKTKASMVEAVLLTILNPGCVGVICGPTYDLAVSVLLPEWEHVIDGMHKAGYPIVKRFIRSMMEAELVCGGKVLFRSHGKVESLRGFTLAWCALDESEVSQRPRYVFDVMAGRLRDPRANVLQMHVTTTPQGLRGVPEMFVQARHSARQLEPVERDQELRRWYCMRASSHQNSHLPDGYLKGLQGYSKRMYEQEVMGRVLQPSSAVWPEFDRATHCIPYAYDPALPYSISVDWGRTCHAVWLQRTQGGAVVVFDEYTGIEGGTPRERLRAAIVEKCQRLGRDPEYAVGDRAVKTEMAWMLNQFPDTYVRRMNTKYEQSVSVGVEIVRAMLDPIQGQPTLYVSRRLAQSADPRGIVKCLAGYRYKMRSDGTLDPSNFIKDGRLDHGADALRMGIRVLASDDDGRGFNVERSHGLHHQSSDRRSKISGRRSRRR